MKRNISWEGNNGERAGGIVLIQSLGFFVWVISSVVLLILSSPTLGLGSFASASSL
jgi:hypothetical protein